ncbi:MAG: radical SAM protein [Elusimicrobia bacterium]|nr:radical SAM protein [Elusimicrobiota bacterium]
MADTFLIRTFGCKTNQIDSGKIVSRLVASGWIRDESCPKLCVVASCCVTERAEKKVFAQVMGLKKKFPSSKIVVSGCVTESLREKFARERIATKSNESFEASGEICAWNFPRYFLKIQNGCDDFCGFCIVPYLRGKPSSVPPADIFKEMEHAFEKLRPREVVLSGTNIMKYEIENFSLIDLVYEISRRFDVRIRLSSLSLPFETGFIDELSKIKKFCPHFHISLQSGSDRILGKMFRKYTVSDFMEAVRKITEKFPGAAITTDLIFGYPGESAADFRETVKILRRIDFCRVHIFPFSPRPGTIAALFETEKSHEMFARKKIIQEEAEKSMIRYRNKFAGKVVEVVVEKQDGDFSYGVSENYLSVKFTGAAGIGDVVKVFLEGRSGRFMKGVMADGRG